MARPGRLVDFVCVTRSKALLVAALLLAVFAVVGATATAAPSATARSERQLRTLNHQLAAAINTFRRAHGLVPLRVSVGLNASARQHSVEMGEDGYFDHPSADGTVFWKRIKRFYGPRIRPGTWFVGENLLWQAPGMTAKAAVRAWLRSPEHRENLLRRSFRDVGIAAVRANAAPGVYEQRHVTVLTVDFGTR